MSTTSATDENLHELLRSYRCASAAQRTTIEGQVFLGHLDLAEHLADCFAARGYERDALDQVARFGLLQAIRDFDDEAPEFVPFATVTILGEFRKYERGYSSIPQRPRDQPAHTDAASKALPAAAHQ